MKSCVHIKVSWQRGYRGWTNKSITAMLGIWKYDAISQLLLQSPANKPGRPKLSCNRKSVDSLNVGLFMEKKG